MCKRHKKYCKCIINKSVKWNSRGVRGRSKSKYVGVQWHKKRKIWKSVVCHNGKQHYCGAYENELDAAIAVNKKCEEMGIRIKNPQLYEGEVTFFYSSCT